MSEAKESEDKKSLSLGTRPRRLELKKTVETGQVRQSFSHGRSKAVTVEVRKKRPPMTPAGKPVEVAAPAHHEVHAEPVAAPVPATTAKAVPAAAPVAVPSPAAVREKAAKGRVVLKQLTDEEKASRARALGDSRKADAEARRQAEEDAKRHAVEEAKLAAEREAAGRRAAEEEARKKAEEDSRRRAEEEASRRLATEPGASGVPGAAVPSDESDEEAEARRKRAGAKLAPNRPIGQKLREPRRRSGKLTITKALNEEERVRSLASFRRARERERRHAMGVAQEAPKKVIRDVVVPESITVQELANRMAERGVDVIKSLMKMGVMATINQVIDADTAELLVQEFGHRLTRVAESDVEAGLTGAADMDAHLETRPPVVTIMGHVDHGKTSLLDALRETDVASREAGGITQHIGAYQVTLGSGARITFLDTPGHEAFTAMRARGAKVTDLVVLVVAADDAVMPQTVEAIRHAKAANVPMIVAINKVDKPDANPQRVRQQLLQHEVVVEGMGGDVLAVEVSAKAKTGLDKLEEAILLQSEILDLKANPNRSAEGVVIEAKLDRGRGAVATVLVQRGTLRVGDVFVAGAEWGRVRALIDDHGNNVESAGPAVPVEVLGMQGAPEAGDEFSVVETEARAREVSDFRRRRTRDQRAVAGARSTLEQMFSKIKTGEVKELAVVFKADVQGSLEAILASAGKLATEEVAVRVLHGAVGGINESDVTLARASGGIIIGFNVRANKQARDLATRDGVDIRYYSVIYNVIDDLKGMLSGMLAPRLRENFLGNAEIREVFNITKVGKVAGCMVTEGQVKRGAKVRLLRDNVVIHEGTLSTLKRFKDEVREVKQGTECGMAFENYHDMQVGDVIECFEIEEVARQL
jgi:translation initiation factor IF-2